MVDNVSNTLAAKFSAGKILAILSTLVATKNPPVLQALVRGLTNIIKLTTQVELESGSAKFIKPLFIVR